MKRSSMGTISSATSTGVRPADRVVCDYVKFFPDGSASIEHPRLCDGWSYVKAISHHRWWTTPSATIIRRPVLDDVGGFDIHLRYIEDMDLWPRVSWRHYSGFRSI
jgi:hypothetical protein